MRIIAATHKNLEKMIEQGKFREDLYFRLKNITICTTPLRERPEDIEPLITHFTEQICKENGFVKNFQRRCLDTLKKHSWRGNVRELISVVESHLVKSETNTVRPEDLDSSLFGVGTTVNPKTLEEIDQYLEAQKREYITGVIQKSVSRADASKELGISKQSLNYFIDKWNL